MFNTDPSNCGLLLLNKDRVGAGEPSRRETPNLRHARRMSSPTHGNPRQPQPEDPQKEFDFDDPQWRAPE